jgi:rfaE bifunctional protein kinase chain/domain
VLVIGDVMVDSYIWGDVARISPEAPVPVVSIHKEEKRLGGAANVARNILALGAKPILCSAIGADEAGQTFLEVMKKRGLPIDGIVSSEGRTTSMKERILSGYQQLLRVDKESLEPLDRKTREALLRTVERHLSEVDVVIFEDYDKGVLSRNLIRKVVEMGRAKGIPTVVDPKKENFFAYQHVTLFKPNLKEIRDGMKLDFDARDNDALANAVRQLREKLDIEMALITRSELGVYMDAGGERNFIPAHIRSVSDVSGAGDTVVSTAALCLALELPPRIIAGLSNLAGGLVCEHLGVVPVDKGHLIQEARKNGLFKTI